jgi:hypothetical protein
MSTVSFLLAVLVLIISSTALWFISEMIEGKQSFELHFGNILLVTLIGSAVFLFWGWISVALVLGLFGAFWIIAAVAQRFQ